MAGLKEVLISSFSGSIPIIKAEMKQEHTKKWRFRILQDGNAAVVR